MNHSSADSELAALARIIRVAAWSVLGLIMLGLLVAWLFPAATALPATTVNRFIPGAQSELRPEPLERLLYLLSCLALPVIITAAAWGDQRFEPRQRRSWSWVVTIFAIAAAGMTLVIFITSPFTRYFCSLRGMLLAPWIAIAIGAALVNRRFFNNTRVTKTVFVVTVALSLVITVSYRVFSMYSVDTRPEFIFPFNAVIFSAAEAYNGVYVSNDLPAQYGLYSLYLKPLYNVIGFSILKFTLSMTIIQLFCWVVLMYIINKLSYVFIIKSVFLLGLLYLMGAWYQCMISWDPYYQYYPIRVVFPVVALLLFMRHTENPHHRFPLILLAATSGFGVLWNLDSGLVTWLAILATFICVNFITYVKTKKLVMQNVLVFLACSLVGFALSVVFLSASNGKVISLTNIFTYQVDFYGAGFYMLPMPTTIHAWMVVAGIYVLGLVWGAFSCLSPTTTGRQGMICIFLSILGAGLFSYYQGRSQDFCLPAVAWPAWLLLLIMADHLATRIQAGALPRILLVPTGLVMTIALCWSVNLFACSDRFAAIAADAYRNWRARPQTEFSRAVAAVRSQAAQTGRRQLLILSQLQGEYYAETGLCYPFPGPSLVELLRRNDATRFAVAIQNAASQRDVAIDATFNRPCAERIFGLEAATQLMAPMRITGQAERALGLTFIQRSSDSTRESAGSLNQDPPCVTAPKTSQQP
jgi:hypothetical protein